jgi:hypothetical protein
MGPSVLFEGGFHHLFSDFDVQYLLEYGLNLRLLQQLSLDFFSNVYILMMISSKGSKASQVFLVMFGHASDINWPLNIENSVSYELPPFFYFCDLLIVYFFSFNILFEKLITVDEAFHGNNNVRRVDVSYVNLMFFVPVL